MATLVRKISTHAFIGEPISDQQRVGAVHLLSEKFVGVQDLQEGQRGLVVEDEDASASFSPDELSALRLLANGLLIRELYNQWYKKMGRKLEKELVKKLIGAAPDDLKCKCHASRFRDVLRLAFSMEEDDEDSSLLELCSSVLQADNRLPADSFVSLQRVICSANSTAHDDDVVSPAALDKLLSSGPGNAEAVARAVGKPAAADMVRSMAKDLRA